MLISKSNCQKYVSRINKYVFRMGALFFKHIIIILFLLIKVKDVFGYFYPMCSRSEIGCQEDSTKHSDENFISIASGALNCMFCSAFSLMKKIVYNIMPKANIISNAGIIYKYKPPPSLFETLAIWTGAKKEDNTDDEIWEAQKLFMLASATIFSMLCLYYGQYWFVTCRRDIREFKGELCHYCKKYLTATKLSPSDSYETCTCETEEYWNQRRNSEL